MSTSVHVFVGPSLPPEGRATIHGVEFHPPAVQGDVYSLALRRPLAIGIVDGYFERVASVWHKEILWALSEGVHIFGASSMGALRAAELNEFGMVGVGRIFDAFASGELTDDDEVTLVHADETFGYRRISDAMVNLRATIGHAVEHGVLREHVGAELTAGMKQRFYPDRSYARLITDARTLLSDDDFRRLEAFLRLREHRIDQKQLDALELLETLTAFRDSAPGPKRVPWTFQHTDAWEQVRRTFAAPQASESRGEPIVEPNADSPRSPMRAACD
jgi:hypothetical protein